ncbi:MAG: ABC transporter substrate-binding protein, partial [Alphaproteobacteria bacterium]
MKKTIILAIAAAMLPALVNVAHAQSRDTLTIGMGLEPPHLDPTAGAAAAIDEVVYANLFEGLTRIDENGAVQPQLATSWEVSEDGLTYTFHLKSGVKFHDGSDFDADDVVFSLDRARGEDSVNAQKPLFAAIDKVEATDPATVTLTLSRPEGQMLFNLGWGDAVIVAPETAENNKSEPVGTGPFKFGQWVKGDRVEIVANDDRAKLKQVTFKFISDASAQMAAMMAEDIDAFANFGAPETVAQFQADSRFEVAIGSTEGETILSTNNTKPPFNDVRVRQAIAHAIDRQEFIDGVYFGFGTPIGSHFPPPNPAYVDLTGTYPLDLDKAKALLAEAGFP